MSSEIKGSLINLLRQASIARSIDRWLILSAYCGDVLAEMVLSRLRSGLPTHLCGLSFECQGAFST